MTELLPSALYARPEAFQRERRAVFTAAWLLLGRLDTLGTAGDYLAMNLAGWPVFAVRDAAGDVAVCRNVCRHQALPVLNNGAGNCGGGLRCRYHGWSYDLGGRFVAAPAQVAPADPSDPVNHLPRVAAETRHGLLFVHLAERGAPPPLDDVGELSALEGMHVVDTVVTDIDANWKLAMEHELAAGDVLGWRWPNLVVAAAPHGVVLRQIVPRAFQRTQRLGHLFVEAPSEAATLAAAERHLAQAAKAAAETAHAAHEAGAAAAAAGNDLVAAFRALVRAAHPESGTGPGPS